MLLFLIITIKYNLYKNRWEYIEYTWKTHIYIYTCIWMAIGIFLNAHSVYIIFCKPVLCCRCYVQFITDSAVLFSANFKLNGGMKNVFLWLVCKKLLWSGKFKREICRVYQNWCCISSKINIQDWNRGITDIKIPPDYSLKVFFEG